MMRNVSPYTRLTRIGSPLCTDYGNVSMRKIEGEAGVQLPQRPSDGARYRVMIITT